MRKLLLLVGLPLLACLTAYALLSQAAGTIHYVGATPGCAGQSPCYATIQAAVNAAQAGDTVRIQAGTYNEAVLIQGKNNGAAATEADRITIEADPAAPLGSVVLGTTGLICTASTLLQIDSSKFITLRGLTLAGAGKQALTLAGKPKANTSIRIERNRILGNGVCPGGVLIGKGNVDTLFANNLIHGNATHGLNFKQGVGGPHYVVGNTIHGNGKNGVYIGKGQTVWLVNNSLTGNGTVAKTSRRDGFGVKRKVPAKQPTPALATLRNNLICGNGGGELNGPLLDATDAGNLTPTGTEGTGVSASPGCDNLATVYTNRNGADNQPSTKDDDFTLAASSPAIDQGVDPRTLGFNASFDTLFLADFVKAAARPRDGDQNGSNLFDMGALEKAGACEPGAISSCYAGPGGTQGVGLCTAGSQTCTDGGALGSCVGQVLPSAEVLNNGIDEDCDGHDDVCISAATASCYTGPGGTENVGICHGGTKTCDATGAFGACVGQVTPGTDTPNNSIDENCDGHDAECSPEATQSCYTGPAGTQGVGICHAGTKTCGVGGTFGSCTGEVLPGTEIPDSGIDEDCDGEDATSGGRTLPPEPSTVAPPPDPTVATTIGASTEFLYTGTNPIQTGVDPGTIEPHRAAVLRGKVLKRNNTPLSGATISILDHPEFGQTLSREDGMFDMAVNGGGLLTVKYEKTGFLPAQRQVEAPWQDFTSIPDVVLAAKDSQVTMIDLTASTPIQVARGSMTTDSNGQRQATVLIPQGTQAQIYLPDGSKQSVDTLHIRLTEYTVGDNGPEAMPASLPPTSGYTYAVELGADEATIKKAGKDVLFTQPVFFYVENFLGFPVGIQVPVGYYDRDAAAWVPAPDGRVVKVVSVTSGAADLDTDGDGAVDNGSSLGVTSAERESLASLYSPNTTLWRVPVEHFSTYDPNYGIVIEDNSGDPPLDVVITDANPDKPIICPGSIIECQKQVLGEQIALTGTPFSLHYASDRVSGRVAANTVDLPLSGPSFVGTPQRIDLVIRVAGRTFTQSFPANTNQRYTFVWDGKDVYGRPLQGRVKLTARVGYVYRGFYALPPLLARSFGFPSGVRVPGNIPARQDIPRWREVVASFGPWDNRGLKLGGWSLGVHHAYDTAGRVLYLGDGQRRSATGLSQIITTVAGTGILGFSGDGGPATQARLNQPAGVALGPDGSLYIADHVNQRIRRVGPDGIITTVAGTGVQGFSGDGGPATQANLNGPFGVGLGPDGSFYIPDYSNYRIRRVGPDGIITTVAGTGTPGFSGDGSPATQANLSSPTGVALGPDGSLYIADSSNNRIRRVGPDGIISTVAGNGAFGFSGDGGPATQAHFNGPSRIVLGPGGSLYISDLHNHRIRRVGLDGIITTVAGTGTQGFSGDGDPATQANLFFPYEVGLSLDGSLYIGELGNYRIRRVGPDGIITTAAGTGAPGFNGDSGPATQASLSQPQAIGVGPDGGLYIADPVAHRIRKVTLPLPGFSVDQIAIPSEDGTELYQFDATGRHLKTLNALTGATVYEFSYDANGRLSQVKDGDNNITTIERNGSGDPTAIVAPFGQRTTLTINANGYLASMANPAGETHQFTYTTDGLMTSMRDPRNHDYTFTYDAKGRLTRDDDPAGGFQALARTDLPGSQGFTDGSSGTSYDASRATALGRTTNYRVSYPTAGPLANTKTREVKTNTFPDGTTSTTTSRTDGTEETVLPDGTTTVVEEGPDPRFGMLASITKQLTTTTGGLTSILSTTRDATLSDPANLLSLDTLTETSTVNGRTYASVYNAASKTFTATSPQGRQSTATIDAQGRVTQSQVTGLLATTRQYDSRGRLASLTQGSGIDARTVTFSYKNDASPSNGYLDAVTDPLNREVSFVYDAVGRVTSQTLPDGRVITYNYDANGNLASLSPPGKPAHEFAYTPIDLQASYTPPDPQPPVPNPQSSYAYNLDRQLTQVTRPDGKTITLGYDTAGRVATQTIDRGQYGYVYNATTGKLETIAAPGGSGLAYTYAGSLLTGTAWSGPVAGDVTRTYDNNFHLTSIKVNGANAVSFTYDNDSLLTSVGGMTLSRNAQNGLLTGTTLGNVTDAMSYSGFGEMASYSATANGSSVLATAYIRDKLGRITQKQETIGGVTDTYAYTYDLAGRLIEVQKNTVTIAAYTYDSNGNRLTGPGITTTSYDNQDRLLQYGSATYTYTANGELLTKTIGAQTTNYTYDELGNLLSVTLPNGDMIEYLTDGQNRRIGKKVNTTLVQGFLYQDQLKLIAELDGSGAIVSRFVYGLHVNVPDYMVKGGETYRIITDHLGSPRLVINTSTNTISQRLDYDEFGNVINDTNPGFQPFGFAGGLYDRDTGLVRFGARDYDAVTGRWTSKDPIFFEGTAVQLYEYSMNDAINLIDSSGLEPRLPPGVSGGEPVTNPSEFRPPTPTPGGNQGGGGSSPPEVDPGTPGNEGNPNTPFRKKPPGSFPPRFGPLLILPPVPPCLFDPTIGCDKAALPPEQNFCPT